MGLSPVFLAQTVPRPYFAKDSLQPWQAINRSSTAIFNELLLQTRLRLLSYLGTCPSLSTIWSNEVSYKSSIRTIHRKVHRLLEIHLKRVLRLSFLLLPIRFPNLLIWFFSLPSIVSSWSAVTFKITSSDRLSSFSSSLTEISQTVENSSLDPDSHSERGGACRVMSQWGRWG